MLEEGLGNVRRVLDASMKISRPYRLSEKEAIGRLASGVNKCGSGTVLHKPSLYKWAGSWATAINVLSTQPVATSHHLSLLDSFLVMTIGWNPDTTVNPITCKFLRSTWRGLWPEANGRLCDCSSLAPQRSSALALH